jgi:hypothetical protein
LPSDMHHHITCAGRLMDFPISISKVQLVE